MAEPKTRPTKASVKAFVDGIEHPRRQADSRVVLAMMRRITGKRATMWGDSIVGFGRFEHTYADGHTLDWFLTGFSPRKQSLTLYIMPGFSRYAALMKRLGKHRTGKSCLYINRLDDVDLDVLEELVAASVEHLREVAEERKRSGAKQAAGKKATGKKAATRRR